MKEITPSLVLSVVRSCVRSRGIATHATLRNYLRAFSNEDIDTLNGAIRKAIEEGLVEPQRTDRIYNGMPIYRLIPIAQIEDDQMVAIPPWEKNV